MTYLCRIQCHTKVFTKYNVNKYREKHNYAQKRNKKRKSRRSLRNYKKSPYISAYKEKRYRGQEKNKKRRCLRSDTTQA